ncbi:hypothetical protein [Pararhizobium antarcticum]|uniref:Uncharacterized protein n=1 Tax=Pararhizobium antarcticum TaxID=1798805 RepID=A0A657LN63_9HYPH|nr:hypothetical protein [Pararhizobium antarcticum]OJF91885.1 hypothetical protein AX760_22835 [Pararhizobium antarcticum]OJF97963.1 hypothetical protein AX761_13255 [Rhizobium sp. 58]
MKTRLCSATLAALLLASWPAVAAGCAQEQAIYADPDGAYELRFEPVGSTSAATSNHFKLAVLKTDLVLDGVVMEAGDPPRPAGMIMNNCPEGDTTGDELAACTIWEGVLYAVDAEGKIGLLSPEGTEAAAQILLPDLGPAIRSSSIWGKATVAPFDVLALTGCKP